MIKIKKEAAETGRGAWPIRNGCQNAQLLIFVCKELKELFILKS